MPICRRTPALPMLPVIRGRRFVLVAAASITLAGPVQAEVSFDRPGIGFGTTVLESGQFSWEQGLPDFSRDRRDRQSEQLYTASTLWRLGLGKRVELQLGADLLNRQSGNPLEQVQRVLTKEELISMQEQAASVYAKTEVVDYIVALIDATRNHPMILRGASPRATLSVTAMAKAVAFIQGRDFIIPKDVQTVFANTVSHRLLLAPEADAKGVTSDQLLGEILGRVAAPKL